MEIATSASEIEQESAVAGPQLSQWEAPAITPLDLSVATESGLIPDFSLGILSFTS